MPRRIKRYTAKCRSTQLVSNKNHKASCQQIDATVFNFIKSLKILKHKQISLTHISKSLKLPPVDVADSITRLQNYGLKIRKI